MDTVYAILVKSGPEWDGQRIVYTKSKAVFEQISTLDGEDLYFDDFSEELKFEVMQVLNEYKLEYPETELDDLEGIDISSALLEYLEYTLDGPVILAGDTEFYPSWSW
jgi:hypothetical protein